MVSEHSLILDNGKLKTDPSRIIISKEVADEMVVVAVRGDGDLVSRARTALDGFYENKDNADYYDLMDFLLETLGVGGYNPADVIGYLFEYTPDPYERSPGYGSRSPKRYKSPGKGGYSSSPKKGGRGSASSKKRPREDPIEDAIDEQSIGGELGASAKKSQKDVYRNKNRSPKTERLIENPQGRALSSSFNFLTI